MASASVITTEHVQAEVLTNCTDSPEQPRQHLIVLQHGYFGIASLEWPYTRHALLALEKQRNLPTGSLVVLLSNVAPALRSNRGGCTSSQRYTLV